VKTDDIKIITGVLVEGDGAAPPPDGVLWHARVSYDGDSVRIAMVDPMGLPPVGMTIVRGLAAGDSFDGPISLAGGRELAGAAIVLRFVNGLAVVALVPGENEPDSGAIVGMLRMVAA
jgi:hypothetical protein